MHQIRHQFIRGAAALALSGLMAGLMAGCATVEQRIPPGSPLAAAQAELGQPNFTCTQNGKQRVIWTQQPMGQYAWGANVGTDGKIDRITSLLTTENFRQLGEGSWSAERVRCEFGPPARIEEVGLPSVREVVWSYRFKENQAWDSLMYVYMGRNGDRVTHFHPGPDPMYDRDNFSFW